MSDDPKRKIVIDPSAIDFPEADSAPEKLLGPAEMSRALGLGDGARVAGKVREITELLWLPGDIGEEAVHARIVRALELYESLAPGDGAEGMLAMQMVGSHHAALECLRRAALPGQGFEARDMALKHAAKLMALYERQLRTLQKAKGKGQQKVTVEHVHVAAGGQAIVGNVQAGDGKSADPGPAKLEEDKTVSPLDAPRKQKVRR